MANYFFDTSALAKAYIAETGTNWVRTILDDKQHLILISRLTEVEVIAALTRRFRTGDLTEQEHQQACQDVRHDCNNFLAIDVRTGNVKAAVDLVLKHGLRAYDSLQLASALEIRNILIQGFPGPVDFVFVSSDHGLNTAAGLEGVEVEDPNNH